MTADPNPLAESQDRALLPFRPLPLPPPPPVSPSDILWYNRGAQVFYIMMAWRGAQAIAEAPRAIAEAPRGRHAG